MNSLLLFAALLPTIWSDLPDVAPLRVGDKYYSVSTTMHFFPGVALLESPDLVNWRIASHCYEPLEQDRAFALDGADLYGLGAWAGSTRYHDGWYYATTCDPRKAHHTYIFRSKSPYGPWEAHVIPQVVYDHSLWFEDGKIYLLGVERQRGMSIQEVAPDLNSMIGEKTTLIENTEALFRHPRGNTEGAQLFKRNGLYYLVNIGWPRGACRTVIIHRAKNLKGPYDEKRIIFEHEGIAQGSFIDRPDGSWVAMLFGDRGAVGRCPFVLPVDWTADGWPVIRKEALKQATPIPGTTESDDFSGAKLKTVWEFNHHPDNAHWRLENGQLKITTSRVDQDFFRVRNILTQRTFGPECEGSVKVDGSAMKVGDRAGLALFQREWGALALERTEKGFEISLERQNLRVPAQGPIVWFKACCDFTPCPDQKYEGIPRHIDKGWFEYSTDGANWKRLGRAIDLKYTIPHFTGYRFALFNWATKEAGGTAAFDDFTVGVPKTPEEVYLFTFFSDKGHAGRSGQAAGLHLAWSRDGRLWHALNDDKPVLVPQVGKDKLMRDPSAARGPDGTYHLVWTTSWNSREIGYASTKDFKTWSEQRTIPVMAHDQSTRNSWAPEITYNPDDGLFYIYWASVTPGTGKRDNNQRIYLTTTKDFQTFTPTRLWFERPLSVIDSACVKSPKSGDWLMAVKDESNPPKGKYIYVYRTKNLAEGFKDEPVKLPDQWVEGPSPIFVGDRLLVYMDYFAHHHYGAFESDDDGRTFSNASQDISFPDGIRHGTALKVPAKLVDL